MLTVRTDRMPIGRGIDRLEEVPGGSREFSIPSRVAGFSDGAQRGAEVFSPPSYFSPSFIRRAAGASDSLDDLATTSLSEVDTSFSGTNTPYFQEFRSRVPAKFNRTETGLVTRAKAGSRGALYVPQRALLCVERKVRRQVIFAKRKHGGNHRKPRRNSLSYLWCV